MEPSNTQPFIPPLNPAPVREPPVIRQSRVPKASDLVYKQPLLPTAAKVILIIGGILTIGAIVCLATRAFDASIFSHEVSTGLETTAKALIGVQASTTLIAIVFATCEHLSRKSRKQKLLRDEQEQEVRRGQEQLNLTTQITPISSEDEWQARLHDTNPVASRSGTINLNYGKLFNLNSPNTLIANPVLNNTHLRMPLVGKYAEEADVCPVVLAARLPAAQLASFPQEIQALVDPANPPDVFFQVFQDIENEELSRNLFLHAYVANGNPSFVQPTTMGIYSPIGIGAYADADNAVAFEGTTTKPVRLHSDGRWSPPNTFFMIQENTELCSFYAIAKQGQKTVVFHSVIIRNPTTPETAAVALAAQNCHTIEEFLRAIDAVNHPVVQQIKADFRFLARDATP